MSKRLIATFTAVALVLTACTSGDTADSTATTQASTTTAPPDADVCTALKVADFDLTAGVGDVFSAADLSDPDSLADDATAEQFVSLLIDYYATIDDLGMTAPADIRDDFTTVSDALDPFLDELERLEPGEFDQALNDLDTADLTTPELTESFGRIESWTNLNCGVSMSVDPGAIVGEKIVAAVFASFGDMMGALADGFGDLDGLDLGGLGDLGDLGSGFGGMEDSLDAVTLGDNPELDALWDRCQADDFAACDELYFNSFNVYELFAATCAGTVPFYTFSTSCVDKHNGVSQTYGDDGFLDSLQDACSDGDALSCDQLFGSTPIGSAYETFAHTCGDTRPVSERPCEFEESGSPFAYGDDPDLDALWDACSLGDLGSCDDLFFDSVFGSRYEAFGETCRMLVDRGEDCAIVAELLDGPVG